MSAQGRTLSGWARVALIFEILAAYVPAWRHLRRNDLMAMVGAARNVRPRHSVGRETEHDLAVRLGWMVRRTLQVLPLDGRCLIRSLVLTRLLARRSIPSTVVIGVKPASDFAAHAWVEHAGVPVLPAGNFERLIEL